MGSEMCIRDSSMIYPRLLLARELLHPDGVILISIDDNEQASLRKICDEVFGGYNFIAQIVWEKVHTRKNSAINFSSSHEYILCYAKTRRNNINDREGFLRNLLPREQTCPQLKQHPPHSPPPSISVKAIKIIFQKQAWRPILHVTIDAGKLTISSTHRTSQNLEQSER